MGQNFLGVKLEVVNLDLILALCPQNYSDGRTA